MKKIGRREFVAAIGAATSYALLSRGEVVYGGEKMYGLIGKMKTAEGKRDELVKILLEGTDKMPGCLSYIIANDPADPNAIWITEVWDSKANHEASLKLPSVQAAIAKGRPMITGFGERFETEPVGGHGLSKS
ncbi:MAG: putative quinol monooxygenase [Pyrinomonadaceae bacterium]|nr:putative quinol monooxygenase [Pyrinomonadaceae bacterium]